MFHAIFESNFHDRTEMMYVQLCVFGENALARVRLPVHACMRMCAVLWWKRSGGGMEGCGRAMLPAVDGLHAHCTFVRHTHARTRTPLPSARWLPTERHQSPSTLPYLNAAAAVAVVLFASARWLPYNPPNLPTPHPTVTPSPLACVRACRAMLLDRGAKIEMRDKLGRTALHIAA